MNEMLKADLKKELINVQNNILEKKQKSYNDEYAHDIDMQEWSALSRTLSLIAEVSTYNEDIIKKVKKNKKEEFEKLKASANINEYNGKEKLASQLINAKVFVPSFMDEIQKLYYNKDEKPSVNETDFQKSMLVSTWNDELRRYRVWNNETKKYDNGIYQRNQYELNKSEAFDDVEKKLYDVCRFNYKATRKTCIDIIDDAENKFKEFKLKTIKMEEKIPYETDFLKAYEKHKQIYS